MKKLLPLLLLAAAPPPGAADIVRDAPQTAWRAVAPENLMLIESARGTVAIEFAPDFAPAHVAAIRALVRAGRFDGGAVVRVQDNYVVQFAAREVQPPATPPAPLAAEYDAPAAKPFTPLGYRDAYATSVGHKNGWPVARAKGREWLVHCYAMVGVGRDNPPSTGDGSELYAVSGHAPRHLDRNITLVGRVVEGFAGWTSLARGTEALGCYKGPAQRTPLTRVRLAADVPDAPRFEVMDTASPSFRAYVEARANRRESFFARPAGGVDLCNAPVPTRRVP